MTNIETERKLQEITRINRSGETFPESKPGSRMTEISKWPCTEGGFGEEKQKQW